MSQLDIIYLDPYMIVHCAAWSRYSEQYLDSLCREFRLIIIGMDYVDAAVFIGHGYI